MCSMKLIKPFQKCRSYINRINFREKLLDRENYAQWAFAMKNLLQDEELWDTVQGVYPTAGMNVSVSKDKDNFVG